MKVVVTGCAGLIGSHLVDFLLEEDYDVTGVDNLSYGTINNLSQANSNNKFKFYKKDIKEISKLFDEKKSSILRFSSDVRSATDSVSLSQYNSR